MGKGACQLEGNFREVGVPNFKGLGLGFKGGCGLVYSMENSGTPTVNFT